MALDLCQCTMPTGVGHCSWGWGVGGKGVGELKGGDVGVKGGGGKEC